MIQYSGSEILTVQDLSSRQNASTVDDILLKIGTDMYFS